MPSVLSKRLYSSLYAAHRELEKFDYTLMITLYLIN